MTPELKENEFELFRAFLKKKAGVTLRPVKKQAFARKLAARIKELAIPTYAEYFRYLKNHTHANEIQALTNLVTIDQSSFFRGDRQFDLFVEDILPRVVRQNAGSKKIRIWSAGCSRGQEPYSLAILLSEYAPPAWDIRILATDIDSGSLKTGLIGSYGPEVAEQVPDHMLLKYFSHKKGSRENGFLAKERLKKNITFRKHNLLEFPYPLKGPVDVIFCKNVMIYFEAADKKSVLDQFYHLLPPNGFLCLGGSESLLGLDRRFTLLGQAVYVKG